MPLRRNKMRLIARAVLFLMLAIPAARLCAASLPKTMQSMRQVIEQLWLRVADVQELHQSKTQKAFIQQLETFVELSQNLASQHQNLSASDNQNMDPSMRIMAAQLVQEAQRALGAAKHGDMAWARSSILSTSGYCMTCHTSSDAGVKLHDKSSPWLQKVKGLKPMEEADFLAATRQFDAALLAYEQVLKNATAITPQEWQLALRKSMVILVRSKEDAAAAIKLLNTYATSAKVPYYIAQEIKRWQLSLDHWQQHPIKNVNSSELAQLYKAANQQRRYPADQGAMIDFLRLSSLAHRSLRQATSKLATAQALLYLGYSYQALLDLELWPLHDVYYEACIRQSPHSEVALQCYEALEASVVESSTGSGGVNVPDESAQLLKTLLSLAKP